MKADENSVLPLITIGIPTYCRPELLRRALAAVAVQAYPHLDVIVADNCTPGDAVGKIIAEFAPRIAGLRYVRHDQNIGMLKNMAFILTEARGEFFMWLADDDEISPNYVASLAAILMSESDAVTACAYTFMVVNGKPLRQLR